MFGKSKKGRKNISFVCIVYAKRNFFLGLGLYSSVCALLVLCVSCLTE